MTELSIFLGMVLDAIFGDPYNIPHPVIFIGKLISRLEKKLNRPEYNRVLCGGITALITVFVSFTVPFMLLKILGKLFLPLAFIVQTFWAFQIPACKCLKTETEKVYNALNENDIEKARKELSYLVGRDTQELNEQEIIKATVETIAENTSDGITAPLFYMCIGGIPLGFAYKAINTLDSMIGYKNEKYLLFGKISAKLDDIANFIPSRITALIMVISAFITGLDGKNAWKIFLRDRNNHLSPNSAQTESVSAGALNIRLGGTHNYFGKPVFKKTIGDNIRRPETADIKKTNKLMTVTSWISLIIFLLIRLIFLH